MKRLYLITIIISVLVMLLSSFIILNKNKQDDETILKIGIIYVGDKSDEYTKNFIKAQQALLDKYEDRIEIYPVYNVSIGHEEKYIRDLCEKGCKLIFANSYGYENVTKQLAQEYPEVQFCQATGDNAADDPVCENYHTFMGEIHQGRYISGVVAGMKLSELIESGELDSDNVVIGYVAAFPVPEVISGYTAFLLGVKSVVPQARMIVRYVNTWSSYSLERECAAQLIKEGCVLISQHSDTVGPAVACEEIKNKKIYHVGYNVSFSNIAPTCSLVSCRINWEPYFIEAVEALLEGKKIEKVVNGRVRGNDVSAGLAEGWVEILPINNAVCANGTGSKVKNLIENMNKGDVEVFKGNYIGVNPNDEKDTYDLSKGYKECEKRSAPSFCYILKDAIEIRE